MGIPVTFTPYTTIKSSEVNSNNSYLYGICVPVGAVLPVFTGMSGCPTPSTGDGWALCNGTTAASQGVTSPTITGTLPNINSGAFVRGNTSSWTTGAASGGADTINLQHSHETDIAHAGHGVGNLQFQTADFLHEQYIDSIGMYTSGGTRKYAVGSSPSLLVAAGANFNSTRTGYSPYSDEQFYTKSGTGSTAALGSTSVTSSNQLSTTQSILPTYFSAVYYMRVRLWLLALLPAIFVLQYHA